MSSSIVFDHVTKRFGGHGHRSGSEAVTALDEVSLEVEAGEFVVVVGPSGCGKSTLLEIVAGLSVPTSGQVLVGGRPVTGPGLDRGVVFQQYALLPWRTATANVEFGLEANGTPRRQRAARAREYLELVGLAGFGEHYPHELSGGMKQRVAIARSLAFDPEVLLMDEPFAALDAQTRDDLQAELLRIWARTGKTIVFVTHGIDEAVYLGQRVAVLSARPGRVKEVFDVSEVRAQDVDADSDVRSTPAFARHRHRVWASLREEVTRTRRATEPRPADGAVAPTLREDDRVEQRA